MDIQTTTGTLDLNERHRLTSTDRGYVQALRTHAHITRHYLSVEYGENWDAHSLREPAPAPVVRSVCSAYTCVTYLIDAVPLDVALPREVRGHIAVMREAHDALTGMAEPDVNAVAALLDAAEVTATALVRLLGDLTEAAEHQVATSPYRASWEFFRDCMPDQVDGYEIRHVAAYIPGDHSSYASALVITRTPGRWHTHLLVWDHDSDTTEWQLYDGHNDLGSQHAADMDVQKRSHTNAKARRVSHTL
ncbi:hypothetical protein GCM10012275_42630 [Longimycelium tulufanense]|uniref:Uncharacterized protein n=1 Tax=Longimycelium tulufanense TaxID=907463 RepID=A0A8J3CHJ3_9PSEU|nr:hypothetical protein [Longimycelium tulufanense]GGM67504.1 hypothetical protein GCM10012275_42630 [Longimycelium tulufanense]